MTATDSARLAIDARLLAYRVGGISTYTRQLIAAFETMSVPGDLMVLPHRRQHGRISTSFDEHRLLTPPHHRLERLTLGVELLPLRLHLLHSPDFIPPRFGAKRNIITVHDMTFMRYPQYLTEAGRRYYNEQIEASLRQADHILAVSQSTRDDVVSWFDVAPHRITVQPNGVSAAFRPLPVDATHTVVQRLGLPARYILHIGTIEPRKNIATLLDAHTLMRQRHRNDTALVLVGRAGWLFKTIEPALRRAIATGHVLWLQDVADDELPAVCNQAQALAMPSHYEGFGMPVLEAMACGIPVVASDNSSFPEVVGNAGLLVAADDVDALAEALWRSIADDEWRSLARVRGLQQAARFTWKQSADIASAVYSDVIATL